MEFKNIKNVLILDKEYDLNCANKPIYADLLKKEDSEVYFAQQGGKTADEILAVVAEQTYKFFSKKEEN